MKTKLASIAAIAALAGCATTPFSYIDGNQYFKADIHSYPVIVLDVDGRSETRNPIMVDPGKRVIRVQGQAAPGFTYGETRTISIDVKPCMRYYLKAVKKNQLQQDFEPEIDYVEPIAGCTV